MALISGTSPGRRTAQPAPAPTRPARACSRWCRYPRTGSRLAGRQPLRAGALLSVGARGQCLEAPAAEGLGAERHVQPQQLLAAGHQQRHAIARLVLLEPAFETVRSDAEVADCQDLVVHV